IKEETLLLALAPGGLAEMSLIAISMDADTALIAIMHILRITLIVVAGPPLFRIIRKQWH
ncbi:MAG: AbrB family transcriptional regulator, partial [Arenicellales bacterium]|nr:AbrB family transcriptional regulator [Arenicellales bacterium]